MKNTRIFSTLLASIAAISIIPATSALPAYAALKKTDDGVIQYEKSDKTYAKNEFVTIRENTYYFDSKGAMTVGWLELSGDKYYFNDKGVMQKGLTNIDGASYYFSSKGKMSSGTIKVKDHVYVFGKDGKLKSKYNGWITFSDKNYYCENGDIVKGLVSFDTDSGEVLYYFDNNGVLLLDGTVDYGAYTLYANSVGVIYKTKDNSAALETKLSRLYDERSDCERAISSAQRSIEREEISLEYYEECLSIAQNSLASAKRNTRLVYGGSGQWSAKEADTSSEQRKVDKYQSEVNNCKNTIKNYNNEISKNEKRIKEIDKEIKEIESILY